MDLYNDNERFISILSDYGFKATFGNESDTRFLRKALQALINSPVTIREVTFIQNEIKGIPVTVEAAFITCFAEMSRVMISSLKCS